MQEQVSVSVSLTKAAKTQVPTMIAAALIVLAYVVGVTVSSESCQYFERFFADHPYLVSPE